MSKKERLPDEYLSKNNAYQHENDDKYSDKEERGSVSIDDTNSYAESNTSEKEQVPNTYQANCIDKHFREFDTRDAEEDHDV
jgi:hypothetical protein